MLVGLLAGRRSGSLTALHSEGDSHEGASDHGAASVPAGWRWWWWRSRPSGQARPSGQEEQLSRIVSAVRLGSAASAAALAVARPGPPGRTPAGADEKFRPKYTDADDHGRPHHRA